LAAVHPTPAFWRLQANASANEGVEVTFRELDASLHVPDCEHTLERLAAIRDFLAQISLELRPPLTHGSLDSPRVLRFKKAVTGLSATEVVNAIAQGEAFQLEFKSSLMFDRDKARREPGLGPSEYKNEAVLFSTLKTIAAFMNCNGGQLFVGVSDHGDVVGIESDFSFCKKPDADAWALMLRDRIQTSFRSGPAVNDYVAVQYCAYGDCTVARISVAKRRDLCYLTDKDGKPQVYRRQGNRSNKVEIWEIEEFVRLRDAG